MNKRADWRVLSGLVLATAIAYLVSGQVSFSASVSNQTVTPVFFAAEGFGLAAVLLFGPWMAVGVFLGQLALALHNHLAIGPAFLVSIINSSEALLGLFLFKSLGLNAKLQSAKDLGGLLALIFFVLQPFSATLGNLVLMNFGIVSSWDGFWESWKSWWVGNCMGQAHIAPASLVLYYNLWGNLKKLYKGSAIPLIFLACTTWVVFNQRFNAGISLPLVIFTPLFIWLAIQGRLWMVCLGSMILSVVALRSTSLGMGPFVSQGIPLLFEMNVFLLGLAITAQFVAVLYEERTVYEQALLEANDKEQRASQAKTNFLANVSHEIRTPMNAIIGMTAMARDESASPRVREMLQDAHKSGRSLLLLLDQILDFSKLEAARMLVVPKPFKLRAFLEDLYSLFKVSAQQKGLDFEIRLLSDRCPEDLIADELRLKQILNNLIGNALKFTQEGSVKLELNVISEGGERFLQFAVRDTGIGMTAEQQTKIFEPFVQAESSTANLYGGTGLGLTISAELVKAMNGDLKCKSKQGEGTVFYFRIPLACLNQDATLGHFDMINGVEDESTELRHSNRFKGLQILVVDDHPLNLKIAAAALVAMGANVELAADGPTAINLCKAHYFDVVLMDLQMPGMTGVECIQQLREAIKDQVSIPLIFGFTAATILRHDEAEALRVDGLLTKPLCPDALEKAIDDSKKAADLGYIIPNSN